jgi:hypothetical protein
MAVRSTDTGLDRQQRVKLEEQLSLGHVGPTFDVFYVKRLCSRDCPLEFFGSNTSRNQGSAVGAANANRIKMTP